MVKGVKFRRGTTVEHSAFTGAEGEITIDTDKDIAVVHDGTTVGGKELVGVAATQRLTNKDIEATTLSVTGVSTAGNLNVVGVTTSTFIQSTNLNVTGVTTTTTLGVTGFSTTRDLTVVGVATASTFSGNVSSVNIQTTNLNTTGIITTSTLGVTGLSTSLNLNVVGVTTSSTINDSKGDVRAIPQNSQTSSYIIAASDAGKHIGITTGGVTINASTLSVGDAVTIFNNSAFSQTITQGSNVTLRLAATANTGNRTLTAYGICTLLCIVGGANPTIVISGAGVG